MFLVQSFFYITYPIKCDPTRMIYNLPEPVLEINTRNNEISAPLCSPPFLFSIPTDKGSHRVLEASSKWKMIITLVLSHMREFRYRMESS